MWHLYVVRVERRDEVLEHLNAQGVGAAIHYPTPAHLHPATRSLGYGPGDFPVAERTASEILSLPMYPGITEAQQQTVVDVLGGCPLTVRSTARQRQALAQPAR